MSETYLRILIYKSLCEFYRWAECKYCMESDNLIYGEFPAPLEMTEPTFKLVPNLENIV